MQDYKFEELDKIPFWRIKGECTKIAKEIFNKMLRSQKKGGLFQHEDDKGLMCVYNAMKSLIRRNKKYSIFKVSLDNEKHAVWIKKGVRG